ncbi:unnamed protein product [Caenorhabditis auriculariae]|uniref:HECT-type E3 ubiquitin transferase n=1 Tax=Caenorhabditis auriculariae TaxID=2777116 RepID=A0A8S1H7E9_9PELO|nr:unnamed protein product [Caenorhabditis auriculariae]
MSSFNLAFFSGSVHRDRKQDAMLASLNERERFLLKLEEARKNRQNDVKKQNAAVKIQNRYRAFQQQKLVLDRIRKDFDAKIGVSGGPTEIGNLLSEIAVFYRHSTLDIQRLVKVCSEAVRIARISPEQRENVSNPTRILVARCILRVFNDSADETSFFALMRFFEDFILTNDSVARATTKYGLFTTMFKLMTAFCEPRPTEFSESPPSEPNRVRQIATRFYPILLHSEKNKDDEMVAERFLRAFLSVPDQLIFVNHFFPMTVSFLERSREVFVRIVKVAGEIGASKLTADELWRLRALISSAASFSVKSGDVSFNPVATFDVLANLMTQTPAEKLHDEAEEAAARVRARAQFREPPPIVETSLTVLRRRVYAFVASDVFQKLVQFYVNQENMRVTSIVCFQERLAPVIDTLSSSAFFVQSLWKFLIGPSLELGGPVKIILQNDISTVGPSIVPIAVEAREEMKAGLKLFCNCIKIRVSALADADFEAAKIIDHFEDVLKVLRDSCLQLINLVYADAFGYSSSVERRENLKALKKKWQPVCDAVVSTMRVVYEKDSRVKFLREGFWSDHERQVVIARGMWAPTARRRGGRYQEQQRQNSSGFSFVRHLAKTDEDDDDSDSSDDEKQDDLTPDEARNLCIVRNIPFIIPFTQRLKIFTELLEQNRFDEGIASHSEMAWNANAGLSITVRRDHIYEDSFDFLAPVPGNSIDLRRPMLVRMVNWTGINEEGVDGGGIFREFLSELLKTAFEPSRGVFQYTHDRLLYPNPVAPLVLGSDYYRHFHFLGRMLAKSIYEKQLAELRFAEFFIIQLLGNHRGAEDVDLQHMKSFDPLLFKQLRNLSFLSSEQLEDLQLDFSIVIDELGVLKTINLKPNGSNIRVAVDNVQEYVRLYVNYHLKLRLDPMVRAMRRGVSDVINIEWLAMFSPSEIQILIAGNEEDIDVEDMRRHCAFSNIRDHSDEAYANMFWSVVGDLLPEDKKALLKFITGCSRPPIEGFKELYPPLGILLINEEESLPTSATCMNMLKLPKYSSRQKLEEKLRYAINAGAGFELM